MNDGKQLIAGAILVILSAVWSCPSRADEFDIKEIRVKASELPKSIDNIEFKCQIRRSDGLAAKGSYYRKGDFFRVERIDETAPVNHGEAMNFVNAFDGQHVQQFNRINGVLTYGSQSPQYGKFYGFDPPHTLIYYWLLQGIRDKHWDRVKDPTIWDKRFASAKYVRSTNEGGLRLHIVEFPQEIVLKNPCVYHVYFAEQLRWFPIRTTRHVKASGAFASSLNVVKYKVLDVDGDTIVFPTSIEFEQSGADGVSGELKFTLVVDESSLKINEPLDDELFTISKALASELYDVDEQRRLQSAAMERDRAMIEPKDGFNKDGWSSSQTWLVVTSVTVLILLFIVIRRRL